MVYTRLYRIGGHLRQYNSSRRAVIRELRKVNPRFRVVALSATPGETIEAVCHLVNNLMIQRLELRHEQSLDLAKYTHARRVVCRLTLGCGFRLAPMPEDTIVIFILRLGPQDATDGPWVWFNVCPYRRM